MQIGKKKFKLWQKKKKGSGGWGGAGWGRVKDLNELGSHPNSVAQ